MSVDVLEAPTGQNPSLKAIPGLRRRPVGAPAIGREPGEVPPLFDHTMLRSHYLSPLRYPGSKRQLVAVVQRLISANVPPPSLFVEPFCGGASTSLRLLVAGQAHRSWLNDLDPLVHAFWRVAAFDTMWLVDAMHAEPVTVDRWEYHRATRPSNLRDRAIKCLFLNRTTFSGILHRKAGPIGGKSQTSTYRIDCRFNKPQLEQRIRLVGALAAAGLIVEVTSLDYEDLIRRLRRELLLPADEVVVYLDPPYVDKARTLYEWSFEGAAEHDRLSNVLASMPWRWVLSYDDHEVIRALYSGVLSWGRRKERITTFLVPNRYSAAGSQTRGHPSELLVTNLPVVPADPDWTCI